MAAVGCVRCADSFVETVNRVQARRTTRASVVRIVISILIILRGVRGTHEFVVRRAGVAPIAGPFLKTESQSKLNRAGEAALMVHHTERGSQTHARLGKLRMIEQVEYFSTKL